MGKRKNQIQNDPNLRKSENMVKQICMGEKKVQNSKLSESMKMRKYGIIEKPQPSGINKISQHLDPQVKENKIQNQVRQTIDYLKSVNP